MVLIKQQHVYLKQKKIVINALVLIDAVWQRTLNKLRTLKKNTEDVLLSAWY